MFVKTLFFVALVATVVIMPFVSSSALEADGRARSKAFHSFGVQGMNKILKNHVPQVAAQMQAFSAGKTVARSTAAQCAAITTCAACTADPTCVWGISLGIVGPEENPTGFGTHGTCVSGTTAGPAAGAGLFSIDIFSDGDGTTPAFWSSQRTCATPYRATNLNAAAAANDGIAMRASVEVDSTFGYVVTLQEFQTISQMPQAEQEAAIFNLIAKMFTGIRMYTTIAMAHGGTGDQDRSAFFMFFQAIDLGTFMKNIFAAIAAGKDYDGLGDGAQSVAFLAFFDSLNTFPYTAGAAGTGTAFASIPVSGLTLSTADVSTTTPAVEIHKYTMSGNVGPTGKQMNFGLSCYMASDDWTHLTRTISANAYECDITINGIQAGANNAGSAYGLTLNVIIVSLDTNLGKVNTARAASGNINVGNADFTVLPTASAGSSASATTSVNVITKADPTCATSTFLTAEYKAGITKEFGGSVSPFCVTYSFDASNVNYIFWDPAGAVDEKKATAAANAKARSSSASIAPLIAAVISAAVLAVFAL